jgi:hypothetical protein
VEKIFVGGPVKFRKLREGGAQKNFIAWTGVNDTCGSVAPETEKFYLGRQSSNPDECKEILS